MRQPGWNHLDRRPAHAPAPRDYCNDPHLFGHDPDVGFHTPPDGTHIDRRIAALQHQLILEWRARGRQPTTGRLRTHWGISKQVFSRVVRGERFAGERIHAALSLSWRYQQPARQ